MLRLLEDLRRNEHALARIERMVKHLVRLLNKLRHARWGLVQRVRAGDAVAAIVRELKEMVRDSVPRALAERQVHVVLPRLGMLVEIAFANHVRHARLDDLEAVLLKVALNLVVGARMEVEQVLAHDQHRRTRA